MPLLVDVHPPPDAPASDVVTLMDACSQSAPVDCEERAPGEVQKPGAIVQWRNGTRRVAIWVHVEDKTLYRLLEFSEADQEADRIVAAGLLLGSLVLEAQTPIQEPEAVEPEEPDPKPSNELRRPVSVAPRTWGYLQPSLGLGQGVSLRAGGQLEFGLYLSEHWGAFGQAGVALEPNKTEGVRFQTAEGCAGLFSVWGKDPRVEIGAGFHFQETSARLTLDGQTEQLSTGRAGASGYIGIGFPFTDWLSVFARGRVSYFPQTPDVLIESVPAFNLRSFETGGTLGPRLSF